MKNDHVSTREIGRRNSAGTGYLIIPPNIERAKYIDDCFRRGCCVVALENGGIVENVIIAKHVFNYIDFPLNSDELGSLVFWVNIPKLNTISILAVLNKNNEIINIGENQFIISKKNGSNYIEISGDSDNSKLVINVEGKDNNGELNIFVENKNNTAKLNCLVKGDININSIGNITINTTNSIKAIIRNLQIDKKSTIIEYQKGVGLKYLDEFENEINATVDRVQIKPKVKLDLGNGKEPLLLGRTTANFLREYVTLLSTATVTTALGIMPLMNAAQIANLNTKIEALLSKYSNTD